MKAKMLSAALFAALALTAMTSVRAEEATFNLEDLDFSWMTSGWETPKKNKAVGGGDLQLWDGTEWQTYERGIGTHGASSWYVRLNGNAVSFSATVGVDRESDGQPGGEVNFIVRDVVGGTNLVESGTMTCSTPAKNITVNLDGIELIELYVDMLGSDSWDHADWVNPTIVMKGDAAPATRTADGTNHWIGKGADDFWATPANWEFGVPAADATAVFDESVTVRIGQWDSRDEEYTGPALPEKVTVSNVVVNSGAVVTLRPVAPEYWDSPELIVQEVNGAGKIQLAKVGIKANYVGDSMECTVNVAEIEMLPVTRWTSEIDSWLDGKSDEGKFMVVNSTVAGTGRFYTYGNVTLKGDVAISREFKMHSENASAKTVILDGGWVSSENLGEIEKLVFHSGTYDYADYSDKGWPLYLDGGTVNIGDGSSIGSDGLELGVLSGGYLRYTVSEIPASGVPAFPQNLTFAADADLSNVFAIVKNTSGDAQKTYAITKTGDVYSFAAVVPTDTLKWIGGVDNNWQTAGNWIYGAVPTEGQSVLFERSADVGINQDVKLPKIATLTVESGARVALRYNYTGAAGNYWTDGGGAPVISFDKITGEGTLVLQHVGLVVGEGASIGCAELEIMPFMLNDEWRDTYINGPESGTPVSICANITGSGWLNMRNRLAFSGDNSAYAGGVKFHSVGADGRSDRYFNSNTSFFPNASTFEFYGRAFIGFTEGTARLGNVTMGESYGAAFVVKYGAEVTLEVESGSIRDTYFGNGFEVRTCAQDSEGYDNSTAGCANLTIKKVGEGTLVYGVTKQHNLVVAEGRVEFTGENDNEDDANVNVMVKNGASIGSAAAMTSGNGTTLGGNVTVRHQFTFEPGAAIKQEYIVTTTTDEQTQVETTTYSMRKLTIADDVDLANVVFGVTNPEDLPAVTKALVLNGTQRFMMFAANALSGAVATENGGYTPEGSEKNGSWIARPSRTAANAVEFRPYVKSGFAVNIR